MISLKSGKCHTKKKTLLYSRGVLKNLVLIKEKKETLDFLGLKPVLKYSYSTLNITRNGFFDRPNFD